jgi:hypothetical protein
MSLQKLLGTVTLLVILLAALFPSSVVAQSNQVLGEVDIEGTTKLEKSSGVWVDGQYLGYVSELKGDKRILLLPGAHEIDIRQTGYLDQVRNIIVEPAKTTTIVVSMQKDPNAIFPSGETSQVNLKVTPERAAVFVDGQFAGTAREFGGHFHSMVIAPGHHHVRIALAGYQDFSTEINVRPRQKLTIKTDLLPGSITQAPPAIKSN